MSYHFNGKETDGETAWQDYGMRIYNPALAKFLSTDPLTREYPELTPFQFASNTPICAVDLDGLEMYYAANGAFIGQYGTSTEMRIVHEENIGTAQSLVNNPGQPGGDGINQRLYSSGSTEAFCTPDAAAEDWANRYNGESIQKDKEYASSIYEVNIDGVTYYSYSKPNVGTSTASAPSPAPEGSKVVADIHSHAAYSMVTDSEQFSNYEDGTGDIPGLIASDHPGYVSTPAGSLRKWDPNNKNHRYGGGMAGPNIKGDILSTNIPSDPKSEYVPGNPARLVPKDERRLNNIPPAREYTYPDNSEQENP